MNPHSIKLLGIQAGRGASLAGAEDGPLVLRQRGLVERLEQRGHTVEDLGDIPGIYETRFVLLSSEGVNHLPNVLQVNRHTHACVLGTRKRTPDAFLLVVGGDHSLAIGTLGGLSDACERMGIIWLDAHADFNTPASSPSGAIHGMSLAIACGVGHRELIHIANSRPAVEEEDVYLLGCRDIDPGERVNLEASKVTLLEMDAWRVAGITDATLKAAETLAQRCDHIHLSFDIDVLDAAIVPATGTPVAGGLSLEDARNLLAALSASGRIDSAEFVEYNPKIDADGQTGEVMLELIETFFAT